MSTARTGRLRRSDRRSRRRLRGALAATAAVVLIVVVVVLATGGGPSPLPLPGIGRPARSADPFAYIPSRASDFTARATAGSGNVIFNKSPGGVLATAARVAGFRSLVDSAAKGTGVDPDVLEAIVFLESAGRPNVLAGPDPADAAGLTQILAQTGQSLLGMRIDLARSRRLTAAIDRAYVLGQTGLIPGLQRQRAKIDDRFDPAKALAATVRYLEIAEHRFGRRDLAVVSYHMGIGNLQQVLDNYDGGAPVPYVRLYFDTAPDHATAAYNLLAGFGDDSSLYYWRVLGALQIMGLYRSDRSALARLAMLETAGNSDAEVIHPPDRTPSFADPGSLRTAYATRTVLPLPSNSAALGLSYSAGMGSLARRLGQPAALYRGLRTPAVDLLIELAARVGALSHGGAPLIVASTVTDNRYQRLLGVQDPVATTGYSFRIARRYASHAQAVAFQAMLDRLQALNLIAWSREPATIDVTVASDASQAIVNGP